MTREEAIQVLESMKSEESYNALIDLCNIAIKALSADAENRLYIKIYADDEPSVKAEKLYQICDETQNRKVAEWLKEYFPSADVVQGEWIRVGHDIYECSICHQNVMTKDIDCYSYCHRCGVRMKGGDLE